MCSRIARSGLLEPLVLIALTGLLVSLPGTVTAQSPLVDIATLSGDLAGDQFGVSVAGAGDVNNDGMTDIIVGASANDDGGDAAGKAYIFLGGPVIGPAADWSCIGQVTAGFLGASVAGVGDVNNDGFDDVLIGAPFNNDLGPKTGKALLFLGGAPMDTTPDLVFYGIANLDQFGAAVAGLGDVNGDGFADWAIGAFKADSGTQSNTGIVHVYFGGAVPDSIADVSILGKAAGERFGISISGCGQFNADSYDDFVVGAYSYDGPLQTNVGRAYVFFGGAPPDTVVDVTLTGENAHDFFGYSVAGIGDADADSFDDILVGAKGFDFGSFTDAGKVYTFLGGPSPDNVADFVTMAAQNNNDEYGVAVSGAGDLDGDGASEFLVGADRDQAAGTEAGKAYLYQGAATPPFSLDTTFIGSSSNARLGNALAELGSVRTDLYAAFAVGALAHASSTGVVYVIGSLDTSSTANQAPVLAVIGAQSVDEGQNLNVPVSASDPDADSLILSAVNLPANATFTDNFDGTGTLDFNPDYTSSGVYDVTVIASDGVLADSEVVAIVVNDVNQAPVLDPIGSKLVAEDTHLEFRVTASDPDGTNPALSAVGLPPNASFHDSLNGAGGFFFDPITGQAGGYDILFIASDGPLADSETVTITVHDGSCNCPDQADMNGDGFVDSVDLGFLIDAIFFGGDDPQDAGCPTTRGDFNNDGFADSIDLSIMIDHIFFGGAGPTDPCAP